MDRTCALCNKPPCDFTTHCNHHFYKACIQDWRKESPKSLQCQASVTEQQLFKILLAAWSPFRDTEAAEFDQTFLEKALIEVCRCTTPIQSRVIEKLTVLFNPAINVNSVNSSENTALHYACKNGHSTTVSRLLELGADVNAVGKYDKTPLHYAWENGNLHAVCMLIEHGTNIHATTEDGRTPIHCACSRGNLQLANQLIDCGASIIAADKHSFTPTDSACYSGHLDVSERLIECGTSVNEKQSYGSTLLSSALCDQLDVAIRLAEHGADVNGT